MEKIKRTAICVYVQPEILERLKEICAIEEISQSKLLSRMIRSYKPVPVVEDVEPIKLQAPVSLPEQPKAVKRPVVKAAVKQVPKRLSLAEEMERLRKGKQ